MAKTACLSTGNNRWSGSLGPGFLFSRVNSRFQRLHHRVTLRRWIAHIRMLLKNGKITKDRIALLDQWQYTGFNIYCGQRILPW